MSETALKCPKCGAAMEAGQSNCRSCDDPASSREFERESQYERPGLLADFWDFLKHNKKWWLLPIVVVMLLVGLLVILGGTAAAPFIYTLF